MGGEGREAKKESSMNDGRNEERNKEGIQEEL